MSIIKYIIIVAFGYLIKPYIMEISIITGIIIVGIILHLLLKRKEEKEEKEEKEDSSTKCEAKDQSVRNEYAIDTIGLMFTTLSNIGCQPVRNDDGTLSVAYQGENFHMVFSGRYVRVWDPLWASFRSDDPDMPNIRAAVNSANFGFGPTVVLSQPDADGVIDVHSRRDIMLHPACPDNDLFVRAVLDSFFDTKKHVRDSFQQINTAQVEGQRTRRPVGFTTTDQE